MKHLIACIFVIIGLTGCVRTGNQPAPEAFKEVFFEPQHADGFRVLRSGSQLMLEVYSPDTARIVIPEGGFQRIVCMSSTYVAHLEAAGRLDRLVGASSPQYISSERVKEMSVPDVGYDGAMNYEQLLAVKPELVMLYGIGGPSSIEGKLKELDVPYVYISDFEEQSPLGRAEWVVATGALVGEDMRPMVDSVTAAYRPTSVEPVNVMINAPYSGSWFIPGRDGYMAQLLHDSGARLMVDEPEGVESKPIDSEQALYALSQARVWLCPGASTSLAELKLAVPKARFSGYVWNQTSRFYEDGAIRPDSVLGELKMIMQGNATADSLRYFYRLK